ncbi:MAG: hypothetical protein LC720_05790 [Actinobacteria bacterium]|nr:hypothetical protein [Actinomycetota bacterium]
MIASRPKRWLAELVLLTALAAGALVGPAAGSTGLRTGFLAPDFAAPDPGVRAQWLGQAAAEHAAVVRINVDWSVLAPARPPAGFDPTDPASPGYDWTALDAAVRDARGRGLEPLLTILRAPAWAEGAGRPASAPLGTWRPDPQKLAEFARAAARRYSGGYPDPLSPGTTLPRVSSWQCWNEPNLAIYLTPQWARTAGHVLPSSPTIYRGMLNAFYAAVKAVDPTNLVVEGGTAPYGDPSPGGQRLFPALFVRGLLCLEGSGLRPVSCPNPAHFDVLAHHPYAVAGPDRHALNRDDVAIPDLAKLTRPLAVALRTGRVLPRKPKRLWITEFSWDSNPPDPNGVPTETQARWLEQSFELLWRQGADTLVWLNIRDNAPVPDFASTYQSGVFLRDGSPKPAATAFSFAFVAHRATRARVRVWGAAPGSGVVVVERRGPGGAWTQMRRLTAPAGRVFEVSLPVAGSATLRARLGSATSLPWTVGG